MKSRGSVASLVEALREEVEAEVSRIRRETEEEERRLADAAASEPLELPGRSERLTQEHRKGAELLAREDGADRREALEQREAFVAEAARQGLARLAQAEQPEERRSLLARLITEALERLPGDAFEVVLSEADAAILTEDFLSTLARGRGNRQVRLSTERRNWTGGCLVRTSDGHAGLDNSFEGRVRRFQAGWRAAVAQVYGS